LAAAGVDPAGSVRPAALARIRAYVEVTWQQAARSRTRTPLGRRDRDLPRRWRVDCAARRNRGTTALAHRRDPMPALAALIGRGRSAALAREALVPSAG